MQRPSTSGQAREGDDQLSMAHQRRTHEEKANAMIHNAEQSRAKIYETRGNDWSLYSESQFLKGKEKQLEVDLSNEFIHSAMVDESYHLVGSHVDEFTQDRIIRGEYVDFAKLVPHVRIMTADDN